MGIDVYLNWDRMTRDEEKAQITGFSVTSGDVGYLREAYHGGPYGTKVLVPEEWKVDFDKMSEQEDYKGSVIPNKVLQERLPKVIKTIIQRSKEIYNEEIDEKSEEVQAFVKFVELHRQKQEAGLRPTVYASY